VVELLEKDGQGLNLTWEVRDGILNHAKGYKDFGDTVLEENPATLEGQVVKIADRIAYLNHDIADAIRAKTITGKDLPESCVKVLGDRQNVRIDTMVKDVIKNCLNKSFISMSKEVQNATNELKDFLFERVYLSKEVRAQDKKVRQVIKSLFEHYLEDLKQEDLETNVRTVGDYIAGMTDRYAILEYQKLFLPQSWKE
jgi:dGTPase